MSLHDWALLAAVSVSAIASTASMVLAIIDRRALMGRL